MCGIAGYIGKEQIADERIEKALNLMKKRGPDVQQFVRFDEGAIAVVLLHSRLSIIDMDGRANQPFSISDCTVIFNGEIYNYLELRQSLKEKGIELKTESDTEVLLQSYLVYGEKCVEKFEGMWSFVIYDKRKQVLFASRDRFGEKPLYYLHNEDGIYFASEIKFIRALIGKKLQINEGQLLRYLVNGYKSLYKGQETFYRNINELPWASNMVINLNLSLRQYRYWQVTYNPQASMSQQEASERTLWHLTESLRIRLRADVPLAFCLSGGVDSSALAALAFKVFNYDVHTFSLVDEDKRYNEIENIMANIQDIQCRNTIIHMPREKGMDRLASLIEYHDVPVYTISYYIHSMLSEAIASHGYRVAISGTGADELFTGYYEHFIQHLFEVRDHLCYDQYQREWEEHIQPVIRNPFLRQPKLYINNKNFRSHMYLDNKIFAGFLKVDFFEEFKESVFCDSLLRNRMLNELFHESVPVLLHEDDLNSMMYSIENRSPYLDRNLAEFAYSIPNEHLIKNGYGKYVLREALKGILNEKVRTDRKKVGFNASINSLFDFADPHVQEHILDDSIIYNYVNRESVKKLLDESYLENSDSKFLFNFLCARIFLEQQK